MKRFLTIILGAAVISAFAATPFSDVGQGWIADKHSQPRITAGNHHRSCDDLKSRKDWEFGKPIYDIPEGGEYKLYRRSSQMFYYSVAGLVLGDDDFFAGEVVYYENGDVYMRNMIPSMTSGSYLKGTLEGNKITLQFPQVLCYENPYVDESGTLVTDGFWPVFRAAYELDMKYGEIEVWVDYDSQTMTFTINDDGTITQDDENAMIGVFTQGEIWYGESAWEYKYVPFDEQPLAMPDLPAEEWALALNDDAYATEIAFDGDNAYWQGLYPKLPESAVYGTIDGDKARFNSPVYLGIDPATVHLAYFCGTVMDDKSTLHIADEAVFDYDAEKGRMSMDKQYFIVNAGDEYVNVIAQYYSPTLFRQSDDVTYAAPRNPEFNWVTDWEYDAWMGLYAWWIVVNIPNIDQNGNLLDVDRMWYNIYFDDELYYFDTLDYGLVEDSPDVPYTYDDDMNIYCRGAEHYIYFYWTGYKKIGIQSLFEDEEGNIYKSDLVVYGQQSSQASAEIEGDVVETAYYDLQGRLTNSPKGLCIQVNKLSNGSTAAKKVFVK